MTDMTLSEAQAEAGKLGNMVRALSRIQDLVAFVGSQEQLRSERQSALDKLQADIEAAKATLETTRMQADQIGANNAQSIADARDACTELLAKANADAAAIKAAADAQVAAAQDQAAAALSAEKESLALVKDAQAQLADLQARIDAAKAQAKALIEDAA
jgi:predicted  nucleic acid-binding Zn-ribbon protein